jgi:hypothetical protein
VLMAALLLLAAPGWAHENAPAIRTVAATPPLDLVPVTGTPSPPPETIAGAPGDAAGYGALLILAAIAVLVARIKSRRVVMALLVIALTVFSVEATVHSVHHLGDANHETHCDFASVAAQLSVVAADGVVVDHTLTVAAGGFNAAPLVVPARLVYSPNRGRAPPARPSA